jgi:polyisoprenoid-binding protein YceI
MSQSLAVKGSDLAREAAGDWTIDGAHSSAGFVARHLMISKVRGTFGRVEGAVHIAPDAVSSWAEVRIDAASIDTGAEQRDAHLRSPDFLDADAFPYLAYRTTGLRDVTDCTFVLDGELTIRDVTRPVALQVAFEGAAEDPFGNERLSFSARGDIDREEFGITWNQALETGGVLVGKTVRIELDVTLVRPKSRGGE